MTIVHLIRFATSDPEQISTQLRGYKERELDRSPPPGFEKAMILAGTDDRSVAFYTQWADEAALENTRTSAPWEACMDLSDVFSDAHDETSYEIAS